jgi:hypothetical protein
MQSIDEPAGFTPEGSAEAVIDAFGSQVRQSTCRRRSCLYHRLLTSKPGFCVPL